MKLPQEMRAHIMRMLENSSVEPPVAESLVLELVAVSPDRATFTLKTMVRIGDKRVYSESIDPVTLFQGQTLTLVDMHKALTIVLGT